MGEALCWEPQRGLGEACQGDCLEEVGLELHLGQPGASRKGELGSSPCGWRHRVVGDGVETGGEWPLQVTQQGR